MGVQLRNTNKETAHFVSKQLNNVILIFVFILIVAYNVTQKLSFSRIEENEEDLRFVVVLIYVLVSQNVSDCISRSNLDSVLKQLAPKMIRKKKGML